MRILCPWNIIPYYFRKLGKISPNLSSAAVVIGALRGNMQNFGIFNLFPAIHGNLRLLTLICLFTIIANIANNMV